MDDDRVTVTIADGIADVRLARPDKLNALDPAMFAALARAIDRLDGETGVRAVVLSGAGRAFCAGLDLASMAGSGPGIDLDRRHPSGANAVQQVAWGWRMLPMPVIAAVHGVAFGGGLQILAGADIRIAAPATRLSILEVKWGLVPDMAGFALWRGHVRDDHLRLLAYTGRAFDASEGAAHGFVTAIADDPLKDARTLAREIAARSPDAVRAAKRLANLAADATAADILAAESAEQRALLASLNQVEAVRAAAGNRPARFADPDR